MKTAILAAALPLLTMTACQEKAAPARCQAVCAHVAELKTGPLRKAKQVALHEMDEGVESTEDSMAEQTAVIRKQLEAGDPSWSESAVRKLPPVKRRAAIERHQWEQQQLKVQREQALQHSQDAVVEAKKHYEAAKRAADEELKKEETSAAAACAEQCARGSARHADCLGRTQAVEDIEICDRG